METYQLLTDPAVITEAMPGLKSLNAESPTLYKAVMEVGVAGIKGVYEGQLEMTDVDPGNHYRLLIKGEGPMGFMESDVMVTLTEEGEGTKVAYNGEAKVGGKVAGVGQRMLSGVAKLIINQFFNGVLKIARKSGA
jgi:carbon monoxide dehydrogenase subunit G